MPKAMKLARRAKNGVARETRRDQVMALALAGGSSRSIAKKLGVSHTTVATDIKARLQQMAESSPDTARYRELQRSRLERLLLAHWERSLVDQTALESVLRILDRITRLMGLEIPAQAEVTLRHDVMPNVKVEYVSPGGAAPIAVKAEMVDDAAADHR